MVHGLPPSPYTNVVIVGHDSKAVCPLISEQVIDNVKVTTNSSRRLGLYRAPAIKIGNILKIQ